jgi:hypothetical protein
MYSLGLAILGNFYIVACASQSITLVLFYKTVEDGSYISSNDSVRSPILCLAHINFFFY